MFFYNLILKKFSFFLNNNYDIKSLKNIKLIINSGNYLIHYSIFQHLSDFQGGSISISNINSYLLCENSIFENCSSLNKGGAIYLNIYKSFFYKICASYCFTLNNFEGQFTYQNNQIETTFQLLNTLYCSSKRLSSGHISAFYIYNSKLNLTQNNISKSISYYYSTFYFYLTLQNSKYSFLNIINNNAQSNCIVFNSGYHHLTNSNLINNTHDVFSNAILYNYDNAVTIMDYCYLILNSKSVFERISGIFNVNYCYSDDYSFSTGRSPSFSNTILLSNSISFYNLNWDICNKFNLFTNQKKSKKYSNLFLYLCLELF